MRLPLVPYLLPYGKPKGAVISSTATLWHCFICRLIPILVIIIWLCFTFFLQSDSNFVFFPVIYRKSELLNDLREHQQRMKELKFQLERAETAELEAKGYSHDVKLDLERVEASLRDQAASSKGAINNLQVEIKRLKSR